MNEQQDHVKRDDILRKRDVMVRAYRGQPVRLVARGRIGGRAVEVIGADPNSSIGFPSGDVFQYDAELFGRLAMAYRAGDSDALASAWAQASLY